MILPPAFARVDLAGTKPPLWRRLELASDLLLDEVHDIIQVDPGETLYYNYDFGDDWQHVINLDVVLPREDDAPRAMCTDGRRPAPAEDCGGIYGYELICAATDPAHLRALGIDQARPDVDVPQPLQSLIVAVRTTLPSVLSETSSR